MLLNAGLVKPVLTQYVAYLFDNPTMTASQVKILGAQLAGI